MRPPTDNALVLGNLREYRHKWTLANVNSERERVLSFAKIICLLTYFAFYVAAYFSTTQLTSRQTDRQRNV